MSRVWDVPVHDSTRVRDARVAAEHAADLAGLDPARSAAAALVATELATNLVKHTRGGQLLVEPVPAPAPDGTGDPARFVQIAAIDHGPGCCAARSGPRYGGRCPGPRRATGRSRNRRSERR